MASNMRDTNLTQLSLCMKSSEHNSCANAKRRVTDQ